MNPSEPAIAVAVHDGFYGAGTGAGHANRAFLNVLVQAISPAVRLLVLPVLLNRDSSEYDSRWHAETTITLSRAGAEIMPVDNGTGGAVRFGGLRAFEHLSQSASEALRARLHPHQQVAVILFDVPFLGVPKVLGPDYGRNLIVVPRSTARLHDPRNISRIRFEHESLAATVSNGGRVAAISQFMRQHLQHEYQVPPHAFADLPDGLTSNEKPITADYPHVPALRDGAPFMLALGRAQPYKGWDDLLDALALISGNCPHTVLAAVGEDAEPTAYQQHLADAVRRNGLDVTLLNRFSPKIRNLLGHRMLRAVIVPSRTEPFGRIPLEAYAVGGGPVVATTAGGLAEQVIEGVTGFTAQAEDPAALAAAIHRALMLTEQQRARMKQAGQNLLTERFDHDRAAVRFIAEVAPWSLTAIGDQPAASGQGR